MGEEDLFNLEEFMRSEGKKPELIKGKTYKVAQNPFTYIPFLDTRYLGINNKRHIFETINDKNQKYFFLSDVWIREIHGVITYPITSSSYYLPKAKSEIGKDSNLAKLLKELGAKL